MRSLLRSLAVAILVFGGAFSALAEDASALRLVPFPKEVQRESGTFDFARPLVLEVPAPLGPICAGMLSTELGDAQSQALKLVPAGDRTTLRIRPASNSSTNEKANVSLRSEASKEDYALAVRPNAIVCRAGGDAGLLYGIQTLRQLIRANRQGAAIPCVTVRDWPSLRWRCFQDDMTRGPSSRLETLKFEAALGAYLKLNLMTYYMEYQYAFKKHPEIGPPDGSLTPEDLKTLVEFAKPLAMDILGNQQSFGHFGMILRHPKYAALREAPDVLCPIREETYQLLDDMYSEVCPLLPLEFFNVCCDETFDLGKGPSKELAEKIGIGGVYVRHIRRVHDLLKEKHNKRMMMWGDIILEHPEHLSAIPKDTIMLTWGYDARDNFEKQIIPFAKSGYEFFVCPGVSNWSRILPDFGVATTNIRNFVRDGVKHGALGMLNTDWEDDGEAINAVKWHADAWAAECAWNASKTTPSEFNRRVGAVLFGEKGDHFGRAIERLAETHRLPGMQAMLNSRFWERDFLPQRSPAAIQASAERLLGIVRPAIADLEACRKEAVFNTEVLDAILFGARRMELIGQRMLDGVQAAKLYTEAFDASRLAGQEKPESPAVSGGKRPEAPEAMLARVETLIRRNQDAHAALGVQFKKLWLRESKPYALDAVMNRYDATAKWYGDLLAKVIEARKAAEAKKPMPRPETLGLALPDVLGRRVRPHEIMSMAIAPEKTWAEPSATHRVGIVVRAGSVDRVQLPVELEMRLPQGAATRPVRAFCQLPSGAPQEISAQIDPSENPGRNRLVFVLPGRVAKGTEARVEVYLGLASTPRPLAQAVSTKDGANGMKWIENDKVRLLLGPEGAHVYRWEVKALKDRDLTQPGEKEWAGFSDLAFENRSARHELTCLSRGPAVVRYRCSDASGPVKTVSLYAGASWMEVVLNDPVGHYWDFDNPKNFAADGPTPGTYLFASGTSGAVGREADGVPAQVKAANVHWGIKYNREKVALGLATPEVAANYVIAPGSGAGGVGLEQSPPVSHFVTFAGLLECAPAETMTQLRDTLDFRNPPETIVYAVEQRP